MAEARRRIIEMDEVAFAVVDTAFSLGPGRASGPRRGDLLSLGLPRAASDRDMNWPRVPGGGRFL